MTTRYTSSDIEIHLGNYCEGLDTSAGPIDEHATQRRVEELVSEAVEQAFPGYSVSIYSERAYGADNTLAGWPDALESSEILDIVNNAVSLDGHEWIVESPHA